VYNQTRSPKGDRSIEMYDDEEEESKGTRTGRFSAEHINLTQMPSRQDWSSRFKEIFEPEEGHKWASADFSQQEPRLTCHYAALLDLPGGRDFALAYRTDPLLDNHDYMSKQTKLERKKAKSIFLGLVYSMGGAKLCRELGLPTRFCVSWGPWKDKQEKFFEEEWQALTFRQTLHEENVYVFECAGIVGQEIIDQFHERAPFLRALVMEAKRNGKRYGEIITLLGRHLHLPIKPDGKYDWVHKCLNMLIQGSAADQIKKSMVDTIRDLPHLYLQLVIHDSLCWSSTSREEIRAVVHRMRNAFVSDYVPFRVDKTEGPSWGGEIDLCYHHECIRDAISSKKKYCVEHAPVTS
jgi:DNA polymerase I-like protein with 3'-5' exonuclease and polymerase domains